jgi:hypothetical protein
MSALNLIGVKSASYWYAVVTTAGHSIVVQITLTA